MTANLGSEFRTTIAPWLSVRGGARAVEFYKAAFGAEQVYRIEDPDGNVVARLSVQGAEFWLSDESPQRQGPDAGDPDDESPERGNAAPGLSTGNTVRMVLTVADPDAMFQQAVAAGAEVVYPVSEGHGWRVGRIADPFGHHWEIGCPTGGGDEG
jgi:PhnB protein